MNDASNERRLIERFERRRDEASFRHLYRLHTPRLYLLALRLTAGGQAASEDLVQETWVRAVDRLGGFERRSTLLTWLSSILINVYRERGRRQARATRAMAEAGGESRLTLVDPLATSRTARIDVERALAALPDGYREVTLLHDLYGYTHAEIAERLEIEVGTSKSQLARGRRRLRELLTGAPPAAAGRE